MSARQKKINIFHAVTSFILLIALGGCGSTPKPEAKDSDEMVRVADQLLAKGNDEAAADFYTRALQRSPDDAHVRRKLGEILEAHNDYYGAVTQYRAGLHLPPTDAPLAGPTTLTSNDLDLLRDYGRVLVKLQKPDQAQPVYVHALDVAPDDMRSLNGLGVCLDQLNNHAAAQKQYLTALDQEPNDVATLANLGHSYVLEGSYDQAIKLLEPHLSDKAATPALRQNLAEAYGLNGMDADAERVSKYDLTPEQVQHNLAYYRLHRSLTPGSAGLYADLGSFATADMASAHADDVRALVGDDGISIEAAPEVAVIGGTPTFTVKAAGFTKTATLKAYCAKLKKHDVTCTPRGF